MSRFSGRKKLQPEFVGHRLECAVVEREDEMPLVLKESVRVVKHMNRVHLLEAPNPGRIGDHQGYGVPTFD